MSDSQKLAAENKVIHSWSKSMEAPYQEKPMTELRKSVKLPELPKRFSDEVVEHGLKLAHNTPGATVVTQGDCDFAARLAYREDQLLASEASRALLLEALEKIQWGSNHRRCPACAGWNCSPNGETDFKHTKDCYVRTAIKAAQEVA